MSTTTVSKLSEKLIAEMKREAVTTRKMLERLPVDKYDWKPHPKNMTLRELAYHVAEIPGWTELVLHTSELDFAKTPYSQKRLESNEEYLEFHDKNVEKGIAALEEANPADFEKSWTIRSGEMIFFTADKETNLRDCYCQTVHHRAQLGLYLRLLDIPIPGSYGPSADESFG